MREEVGILVQRRLEQADEALEDARVLLEAGRVTRSLTHRAYYVMFHAVLALLQTRGTVPGKHSHAIGLFDQDLIKTGLLPRELSRILHRAFESRQEADYRNLDPIDRDDAVELLRDARLFVDQIREFLMPAPGPQNTE